jgi:hypothetical protein
MRGLWYRLDYCVGVFGHLVVWCFLFCCFISCLIVESYVFFYALWLIFLKVFKYFVIWMILSIFSLLLHYLPNRILIFGFLYLFFIQIRFLIEQKLGISFQLLIVVLLPLINSCQIRGHWLILLCIEIQISFIIVLQLLCI